MKYTLVLLVISLMVLTGCGDSVVDLSTLPEGDVARGEALYTESINGAPACSSCHALTDQTMVGPGIAGYSEIAGTRVDGQSAEVYTYQAIVAPADYIVSGYGNVMYTEYRSKLTDQDTADLMAFLLTQ